MLSAPSVLPGTRWIRKTDSMEGGGISRSRPLLRTEHVASMGTCRSPVAAVLDCCSRSIAYGRRTGQLRRLSTRILCHLASRQCQPVSARELATALGLKSSVDIVAAARQGIGALRAELGALGLGDLVVSRRGAGYALTKSIPLVVDNVPEDGVRLFCGGPSRSKEGVRVRPDLQCPPVSLDLPAIEPMVCSLGVVDWPARCIWLDGRRLLTKSERDFKLLARMLAGGERAVEELDLMHLCGYRADRSGPELLRRALRHLNGRFIQEGIPWCIRPTAPAHGSPYVLAVTGDRTHGAEG